VLAVKGGKGTPRFRPGARRKQGWAHRIRRVRSFGSYKRAIDWVASMQGLHDFDPKSIRHLPTVGLIHALWETPFEDIANDIVRRRKYLVRLSERTTEPREFERTRRPSYAQMDVSRAWAVPAMEAR
jgi:hypothetical protein